TLEGMDNYGPGWTPDGRSVTFSSTHATGAVDLWTKRADGGAQAVMQLHRKGNSYNARWSPDGKWLLFQTDIATPGAGDIHTNPTFSLGRSVALFPAAGFSSLRFAPQYAVALDDRRFLMIRPLRTGTPDKLIVVENWFEELRAKSRK